MAKSLDLKRYAVHYFELLSVLDGRDNYTMTFPDSRSASAFRFDFYAFTKALEKACQDGLDEERNYRIASSFRLCIAGSTLTFESVDGSVFAKAIQDSFRLNNVNPNEHLLQPSLTDEEAIATLPPGTPTKIKDPFQETLEKLGYVSPRKGSDEK